MIDDLDLNLTLIRLMRQLNALTPQPGTPEAKLRDEMIAACVAYIDTSLPTAQRVTLSQCFLPATGRTACPFPSRDCRGCEYWDREAWERDE